MRHLHALVLCSLVGGCSSLDSGRVVVVSLAARLDRGRPSAPAATGSARGGAFAVFAGLTRPSPRRQRALEPLAEPGPPPARLPCRSEALCAFEAYAVRDSLARFDRR